MEAAVETILPRIPEALAGDDRVALRGLRVFAIRSRPPRRGRSLVSGEAAWVREKRIVFFKAGTTIWAQRNRSVSPLGDERTMRSVTLDLRPRPDTERSPRGQRLSR